MGDPSAITRFWNTALPATGNRPALIVVCDEDFAELGLRAPTLAPDPGWGEFSELHYCAPCIPDSVIDLFIARVNERATKLGCVRPLRRDGRPDAYFEVGSPRPVI